MKKQIETENILVARIAGDVAGHLIGRSGYISDDTAIAERAVSIARCILYEIRQTK